MNEEKQTKLFSGLALTAIILFLFFVIGMNRALDNCEIVRISNFPSANESK